MSTTQLKASFKKNNIPLRDELLQICSEICNLCEITPEELSIHIETFSVNNKKDISKLTSDNLKTIKESLIKKNKFNGQGQKSAKKRKVYNKENIKSLSNEKKAISLKKEPVQTPTSHSQFKERNKPGEILVKFNESIKFKPSTTKINLKLTQGIDNQFKYMNNKLSRNSEELFDYFTKFGKKLSQDFKLGDYTPIDSVSADSFFFGRILCESVTGVDRLNKNSVMFEGMGQDSNPTVVKLDLEKTSTFSLFPGQMIAVKGNSNGSTIHVTELFIGKSKSVKTPTIKTSIEIFVATGPFTHHQDLNYDPLLELITQIEKEKPNLVILIGPFVSSKNEVISSDKIDQSYDDIYNFVHEKVLQISNSIQIVMIPSLDDIEHHYVLPQPSLEIKKEKNIQSYSNPSVFEANEVSIGVCSFDILKHLGGHLIESTITKSNQIGLSDSRMDRLIQHLFLQNSFIPSFSTTPNAPIDFDFIEKLTFENKELPSILILPSDLQQFIKEVNGVIVINPKRISGHDYGSYSKIKIQSGKLNPKVEVLRI
eukprot:gene5026-8623_t